MPSKKRRRAASADGSAAASADANAATPGTVAASFERYPLLPLELREAIIKIACLTSRFPSSPHPPSPFGVDTGTTFSLSLVCRQINSQVTPLLWKSISITRPSSLYALREALLSRPDRRQLIVSLHIGPQDVLPTYWWPLSTVELVKDDDFLRADAVTTHRWIASSLSREALPSGCMDRQAWGYDSRPAGCRDAAIYEAVKEAERSLGVSLLDNSWKQPAQIERVMLAQAALDLYLERVRQAEEQDPALLRRAQPGARLPASCRNGQCKHYLSLQLTSLPSAGASTSAWQAPPLERQAPDDVVVFSYAELLGHLGRPGSIADRFDHPLILDRSGYKPNVAAPLTEGSKTYYPSSARYCFGEERWYLNPHESDRWAGVSTLRHAAARPGISKQTSDSYSAVMYSATLVALLRLAQNVFSLVKNVQDLSLTGFLHGAIRDLHERTLPNLRRLSLGPAWPNANINIDFPARANLETCRIVGEAVMTFQARTLLDKAPQLKTIHWSMERPFPRRDAGNVEGVINCLLTYNLSKVSSNPVGGPAPASCSEDQCPPPLITATLHPTDVARVLNTAASPEIRAAWLQGRATSSSTRRLLLKESATEEAVEQGAGQGGDNPLDSHSAVWEKMYAEGRGWWRGELD